MTGRQGTPRPPTSTFIELRPRTRHTTSVPPLSLASTVSDSLKTIGEAFLRDCEGVSEKGVGCGDGSGNETAHGSARKGTELDKIPLCEWCETETRIKGYGEKKVLERGLENVTKSDGGLTRCRLEKLDEDKGLGLGGKKGVVVGLDGEEMVPSNPSSSSSISPMDTMKKSTGSTMMNERKIRKLIRDSSTPQEEIALLSDASNMGVSEDGNADDSTHSHSDTEPANFGQGELSNSSSSSNLSSPCSPSNIYVSIYDPAGRAFVPSKTKPLPKWMTLLPNNVNSEREDSHGDSCERIVGATASRASLPDAYADGASSSHSEDCPGGHGPSTSCQTEEEGKESTNSGISGDVTPKDQTPDSHSAKSTSDSTSASTRRPSVSTLSSLNIPSPPQRASKTTRARSVSIEEKLPRPNQHPASAYRRANRSSTIESALNKPGTFIQTAEYPDHPPKDISERPLTPYPKEDGPFQGSPFNPNNTHSRAQVPNLLTSSLSDFITPRKGSCCGLSTSLESASVGEIKRRERGESSFDSTFESFPRPEIGKSNSNYGTSLRMSPTLGFLDRGSEYLERYVPGVILPGGSAKEKEKEKEGRGRERGKEKEGIVDRIRRQRVGTVRFVYLFICLFICFASKKWPLRKGTWTH
ncbi:e555464e-faff-4a58-8ab6-dd93eefde0e6 [Sclerotinia trifoliorum]|uniref:E555464e-faff-4a58-8ab6-dd93eefde0e6 n=1 Tax=Sclerotinia trifoliorum TaxID=28548 RepID=A0A8H2ZL56_9HELO|nr:e555464e-faff-4a58-8ab6-dd93eefde0e6 [Sclerotinia trifoliorum]